ncbi:hypothetical protein LUW77_09095 [Streptomyces radiopugnans]|nr:hypothetical protein LUW77_09095 [Streptomyces radiopugnans]
MTISPHPAPVGTAVQPPPTGWLDPTGRVPAVLAAWEHGALGEVPAGIAWDVVRVPLPLAGETVRRMRAARAPLGPVLSTPLGADFVVALGSADGWEVARHVRPGPRHPGAAAAPGRRRTGPGRQPGLDRPPLGPGARLGTRPP